jgi:hypothetical protein
MQKWWFCFLPASIALILYNIYASSKLMKKAALQEAECFFSAMGFQPLLKKSHQIENLVGVLNPCSLCSQQETE